MSWIRKDFGLQHMKNYMQILVFSLILSFLFKQFLLFSIFSFLLIIVLLNMYYFRQVGKKLELVNEKKRIRLLKNTTSDLELTFQNKGIPIWNATLLISFQTCIAPNGISYTTSAVFHEVKLPFSIGYKKQVTVKIPVEGVHRGLARIKQIELQIPHPLTDGSIILDFKPMILIDAIVYPQIHKLDDNLTPSRLKEGYLQLNSSLYDDPFFPVGTREYIPGDQFHHIHWKASARTQQLQTKVFTKVANVSVLFVVNVKKKYGVVADFEEKIEWLASQMEVCYKKDIPYSFAVNIRTFGKFPLVYLPLGSGDAHRKQGLELLAILSRSDNLIPFEKVLAYIDSFVELPVAVSVMTHEIEQYAPFLSRLEQRTNVLYETSTFPEGVL
ncbi:DUF58 domain-containing protein [Psychrobacillus sp. NPDC096389]|uniref:DUF58 domain-containing protein n=1 Tax=Psychrobacillus sp. NPDC096389 TaxID=3364490 RepID=UPI00382DB5F9